MIKRGKYFASVLVDDGLDVPESNAEGKAVGLDVGLLDFCVTSDGSKYANPKHLKKHSRNLKRKQQKLSRKTKGSNKRGKARRLVAKVHSKIQRVRIEISMLPRILEMKPCGFCGSMCGGNLRIQARQDRR